MRRRSAIERTFAGPFLLLPFAACFGGAATTGFAGIFLSAIGDFTAVAAAAFGAVLIVARAIKMFCSRFANASVGAGVTFVVAFAVVGAAVVEGSASLLLSLDDSS